MLATWRLSNLLVDEAGPFNMFGWLRDRAGILLDPMTNAPRPLDEQNVVAQALLCVWCSSVWVGLGLALVYALGPWLTFWVVLPLALSAVACLVNRYTEGP